MIPFIFKVNNVSSGGEVNFGANVLLQQDAIQKNNSPVLNFGDVAQFLVWSPLTDPDVFDTQFNQFKRIP